MEYSIEERANVLGMYIYDNACTVRAAAKVFGVSKSTVFTDVTERLVRINPALAAQVREVLEKNKAERHMRGGLSTKMKYLLLKE